MELMEIVLSCNITGDDVVEYDIIGGDGVVSCSIV